MTRLRPPGADPKNSVIMRGAPMWESGDSYRTLPAACNKDGEPNADIGITVSRGEWAGGLIEFMPKLPVKKLLVSKPKKVVRQGRGDRLLPERGANGAASAHHHRQDDARVHVHVRPEEEVRRPIAAAAVVAGALTAPAAASADYQQGDYTGKNSHGGSTIMRFAGGQVERYGVELNFKCKEGRRWRKTGGKVTSRVPFPIGADGRFASDRTSRGLRMVITGQVVGQTATGTFKFSANRRGQVCKSPTVTWQTDFVGGAP